MKIIIKKVSGLIYPSKSISECLGMLDEGEYIVTIEKKRQIRSLNQLRYYWGVCIPIISEWMGYDYREKEEAEFVHEVLKNYFLEKKVIKNPLDKRRKIHLQLSTTNLDTKEFKEFIDHIRSKFAELNIPAPDTGGALEAYQYYLTNS